MPLYSTDPFSNVWEDTSGNESNTLGSEVKKFPEHNRTSSWCYLFVHHTKVENVTERLKNIFPVFVHKSVIHKREKGHIRVEHQPTISGLIFIQGEARQIQSYLNKNYLSLRLVNDCSTGKVAVIPDCVMQPFMQLSRLDINRIRFMPHSFGYYASGHTLVRITSGILAGLEGYQVRIARDKCLVTSIGGMTVAIGKVSKETFENVGEYIRQRQQTQAENKVSCDAELTPLQQEINKCFFLPQNRLDIIAIAGCLDSWLNKAHLFVKVKKLSDAAEIALFILEEIGSRFQSVYDSPQIGSFKELTEICTDAVCILTGIETHPDSSAELIQQIEAGKQSLTLRYPFLPIEI